MRNSSRPSIQALRCVTCEARDRHDHDVPSAHIVAGESDDYGRPPLCARLVGERKRHEHHVAEVKSRGDGHIRPEVALRLPPANGCHPFGIEEGGGRFIQPAVTRTGDPVVALRLPPANGCDPFGIEEGGGVQSRYLRSYCTPALSRNSMYSSRNVLTR